VTAVADEVTTLAGKLVEFLETNKAPAGLFADDVFLDYTSPLWRQQADTAEGTVALRVAGHPGIGTVVRSRVDVTTTGFVIEVEEVWDERGDQWYARELIRADVVDGRIAEIAVYCTGDWNSARVAQHAKQVRLLRP
jgi:hypothetical protein